MDFISHEVPNEWDKRVDTRDESPETRVTTDRHFERWFQFIIWQTSERQTSYSTVWDPICVDVRTAEKQLSRLTLDCLRAKSRLSIIEESERSCVWIRWELFGVEATLGPTSGSLYLLLKGCSLGSDSSLPSVSTYSQYCYPVSTGSATLSLDLD